MNFIQFLIMFLCIQYYANVFFIVEKINLHTTVNILRIKELVTLFYRNYTIYINNLNLYPIINFTNSHFGKILKFISIICLKQFAKYFNFLFVLYIIILLSEQNQKSLQ